MSYKCSKCGKVYASNDAKGIVEMAGQLYCQPCGNPVEEVKDTTKDDNAAEEINYSSNKILNTGAGTLNMGLTGEEVTKIVKVGYDAILETIKSSGIVTQTQEVKKEEAKKCAICGKEVAPHQYDHNKHRCVNCIIKDGEKMMEAHLWDDAIDEFKMAEPMLDSDSLPRVRECIGLCYLMDDEQRKAMRYLALAETPGSYYLLGMNMHKDDIDSAIRYLKKAAENGMVDAQRQLGVIYLGTDKRVHEDDEESAKWFLMAAKQDAADCQYFLGNVYGSLSYEYEKKNPRVAEDYLNKSRYWYQKAAVQGVPDAQHMFASYLLSGLGGEEDIEQGMLWLRKAADNGNPEAQFSLAEILLDGKYSIERDTQNGVKWLEKAAKNDYDKAIYRLAVSYENGIDVKLDRKKAEEWLRKLAGKGYLDVLCDLAKLLINHNNKIDEGLTMMAILAKKGYVDAMYEMGLFAEREHKLVPESSSEPVKWYKKAAEKKHAPSMTRLGHLFEEGTLVPRDYEKAEQWYRKGMEAGDNEASDIIEERFSGNTWAEKWRKVKKFVNKHARIIRFIITLIIIFLLIRGCNVACQKCTGSSTKTTSAMVYHESEVDEPAQYPGGTTQFTKDLKSLIRSNDGLKGDIELVVTIDEKGAIKALKMSKEGESAELPATILNDINMSLKRWTPAHKNGEPVCSITETITMTL